jgi:A/G-specific adenine glycosylase
MIGLFPILVKGKIQIRLDVPKRPQAEEEGIRMSEKNVMGDRRKRDDRDGRETGPDPARVREVLLAWYGENARDLPWRHTRDPYAIWISETLLQQTRVETALRYYGPFMARWPDLASLAAAEEGEVRAQLSGIGYHSRATRLHASARILVQEGRSLPADPEALRRLPGLGTYTAGALASIAFGRREPAVDGNAIRVLARLLDLPLRADRGEGRRILDTFARALVDCEVPGEMNQTLMDLGASCCGRVPRCGSCPAAPFCGARSAGTQGDRPLLLPRRNSVPVRLVCLVPLLGEDVLLVRRPEKGLWARMFLFPTVEAAPGEPPDSAAARAAAAAGLPPGRPGLLLSTPLAYLNRRGRLFARVLLLPAAIDDEPPLRRPAPSSSTGGQAFLEGVTLQVPLTETSSLPFPAPFRRILEEAKVREAEFSRVIAASSSGSEEDAGDGEPEVRTVPGERSFLPVP